MFHVWFVYGSCMVRAWLVDGSCNDRLPDTLKLRKAQQ